MNIQSSKEIEKVIAENKHNRKEMALRYSSLSKIEFYHYDKVHIERTMNVVGISQRGLILESVHGKYRESFFYESLAQLEKFGLIRCIK